MTNDVFADQRDPDDVRLMELREAYPDDVRKLYELWTLRCGASKVAGSLLTALHNKRGEFELSSLYRLDPDNRASALRTIELFGNLSLLPDAGLSLDTKFEPLLTSEEIDDLIGVSLDFR